MTETVRIAARVFQDGKAWGPVKRRSFLRVDESLAEFSSEIPIILLETSRRRVSRHREFWDRPDPYLPVFVHVIEPTKSGDGSVRARITDPAAFSGRGGIRTRGSSTRGRAKASLTLEIQNSKGDDRNVALLGMPKESDWVLLGPMEYDRALLRNAVAYHLARKMGRYAPRTRFVELFLNEDGPPVKGPVPKSRDYFGVYLLVEKIKRDRNRVPVEKMTKDPRQPDLVDGGFILKVDRAGPGDHGFYAAGRELHLVYPKERNIQSAQLLYIREHLEEFHDRLQSRQFRDPETGYPAYLDVDAAIDYHIVNEFTKNPDSYAYSAYFHKPLNGKITLGPVWDFDRTMGCDRDRRARSPHGWSRNSFRFWYRRLFQDPAFSKAYRERWHEIRKGPFARETIFAEIDRMADEIDGAARRNAGRWGGWIGLDPDEWRREVGQLKDWIGRRLEWYDRAVEGL